MSKSMLPGKFHLIWIVMFVLSCAKGSSGPPCGDGICEAGETWETCPQDCPPVCGDGVVQGDEACDGSDHRGATCESLGFGPGFLECTAQCAFDTSRCSGCVDTCNPEDVPYCDQDVLVSCEINQSGCHAEKRVDCAADGQLCDEGAGEAACAGSCTDACEIGEVRCMNQLVQDCGQAPSGCLAFLTTQDCGVSSLVCEDGECVCPDTACEIGLTRCEGSRIQHCNALGNGCGSWENGQDCASTGWLCDSSTQPVTCVPDCESTCGPEGTRSCAGSTEQLCVLQTTGCLAWESGLDCSLSGRVCDGGTGMCSCVHQCSEPEGNCAGSMRQDCVSDEWGCRFWQDAEDCAPSGRSCIAGSCVCNDQCASGDTRCVVNTVQTCGVDAWGCRFWQDATDCVSQGKICSGGTCICDDQCSSGYSQCSGNTVQTCVTNVHGCWVLDSSVTCHAPAEYCLNGACRGYTRTDFDATYSIITGGTVLTYYSDEGLFQINLPFTFTFYGVPYTTAHASSNGWLSFGSSPGTANFSNTTTLPDTNAPHAAIYGYWDDLLIDDWNHWDANLRWQTLGSAPNRIVVVQWRDFQHYNFSSHRGSFQIRLHETSNIIELHYHWQNWVGTSWSATAGIEDDTRGLAHLINGNYTTWPLFDTRFTPY